MENMNVSTMNAEGLESARMEIGDEIRSLPGQHTIKGLSFTWEEDERMYFEGGELKRRAKLRIISYEDRQTSVDIDAASGQIMYYTFHSTSGENEEAARESAKYLELCATLLAAEFRNAILLDYRFKLEKLMVLKADYETITGEQRRRRDKAEAAQKAAMEKESTERRKKLEVPGQVWYDYNDSRYTRYTVKSVTEKTITFDMWRFSDEEGRWVSDFAGYTKRVSKHLLGQKPSRRNWRRSDRETAVCPVGTDDLQTQKPEQPETVKY